MKDHRTLTRNMAVVSSVLALLTLGTPLTALGAERMVICEHFTSLG